MNAVNAVGEPLAIITSNLVFSEWDRIFKNPMTTAAAIDRLVHHATILEIDRDSIRAEDAKNGRTRIDDYYPPNDNYITPTGKSNCR